MTVRNSTTESRARRRIRLALAAKGYTPELIEWSPITAGAEKSGPDGGWYVPFTPPAPISGLYPGETLVLGYNVSEVLADIERLPAPSEETVK